MTEPQPLTGARVCWLGNPRYTRPLNPTDAKKWALLAGLGAQISVISFAAGPRPRAFTQEGVRFILLPELPTPPLRYLTMLIGGTLLGTWFALRGARIIVAQSPYEGAVGALVKGLTRLMGRRAALVVESHGDFASVVFQQRRVTFAGLYRRLMQASARFALRHTDVLRAVSSTTRDQLAALAPGTPLHQFMAWTDASAFRDTPRPVPLSEARDITYAGVLTPLKGVHHLLAAFAQIAAEFPDTRLWLVGKPQNPDYVAQLHQQVEAAGLIGRVQFVGAVAQRDLAGYMGRARVLVLPSSTEGLARVLVEAMFCGTPVIASRVGGLPDIVEDGVNGYLVAPGDVPALVERLRAVLSDPHIAALGERARAYAESVFSEAAYREGYRALLTAALERSAQ